MPQRDDRAAHRAIQHSLRVSLVVREVPAGYTIEGSCAVTGKPPSSAPPEAAGNARRLLLPPTARGLHRVEAARYVGVSPARFDELVKVGQMPGPKRIGTRRVWDVRALDLAFDALPGDTPEESNPWDS